MEALITSYGINFQDFQAFFNTTTCPNIGLRAIVAGSFALHGYLKQEGIHPGFMPNDIDVFMYDNDVRCSPYCLNCNNTSTNSQLVLLQLLKAAVVVSY